MSSIIFHYSNYWSMTSTMIGSPYSTAIVWATFYRLYFLSSSRYVYRLFLPEWRQQGRNRFTFQCIPIMRPTKCYREFIACINTQLPTKVYTAISIFVLSHFTVIFLLTFGCNTAKFLIIHTCDKQFHSLHARHPHSPNFLLNHIRYGKFLSMTSQRDVTTFTQTLFAIHELFLPIN